MDRDVNTSGAVMSEHAQFRNYSFQQGRWLSPDPYDGSYDLSNPQSFNRYAYALNNPLSLTDPSGLDTCTWNDGTNTLNCVPEPWECVEYGNCPGQWYNPPSSPPSPPPSKGKPPLPVVAPSKGILKQLFCAAANAVGLTSLPTALNSTVGVGAGGSAGIGIYGGVSIGGGVQAVADQQGNVGIAITLQGNPGQGVWGIGASGGGQLMRSNATTIGDLRGTGPDAGASIGDGPMSAGFDFSGSGNTWAGTATVGVGAGLVEHSAGANISKTWLPVSVNCND